MSDQLTARAREMQEFSFQVFEAFTAATVIYIIINIIVTEGMRRLERAVAIPGYLGASAKRISLRERWKAQRQKWRLRGV